MHFKYLPVTGTLLTLVFLMNQADAQQDMDLDVLDLTPFTVYAGSQHLQGAPAVQLGDRMAREARVDLQSRGGERYQTDISIRGGIFEGTGLMVGGLALFDPQTGHYFSEIPLDPHFFGEAYLLTGVQNGVHGFNSTAGTINWKWAPIKPGGSLYARAGTDAYYGGGIRESGILQNAHYEVSVMHETGNGSIDKGDFELSRLSGRIEYSLGEATLRLFGGYLQKFYGWPGMYTGFALNETDDYSVGLAGWQLEWQDASRETEHRMGGYWREVDDDYEFSRENPNNFFEHKTQVYSLQGDGFFALPIIDLTYRWALVSDKILRSTSLVNGDFDKRDYGEAAVLMQKTSNKDWGDMMLYAGMAVDTTNEDSAAGLPQMGMRASGVGVRGSWSAYIEYAESSQVPGYTALNSAPNGLFGGNKDLGRETTSIVETGYSFQASSFGGKIVLFHSRNEDLVDWVYQSGTPTSRQAAPVDIEINGVESWLRWQSGGSAIEVGYVWLDKDEEYFDPGIDASFYALNFARHRLMGSWEQRLTESLLFRMETEFREHPVNALRSSGDDAFFVHAEITWNSILESDWNLVLRGKNLTDERFQRLPGTAGAGREVFATLIRDW